VSEPLPERLFSVPQVAEYLGKKPISIHRLIRAKKLRAMKTGGVWRISEDALREFLEEGINI
jgi:excisionase family DNA binding protein